MFQRSLFVMFLMGFLVSVHAEDVVRLKNGRVIKGVIVGETDSVVVIEMSGLKMKLKQSDVASIQRMDVEKRTSTLKQLRAPKPHQEAYYPAPVRPLFRDIEKLDQLEQGWRKAVSTSESARSSVLKHEREAVAFHEEATKLRDKIAELAEDPGLKYSRRKVDAHNTLVDQMNLLVGQVDEAIEAQRRAQKRLEEWGKKSSLLRSAYTRECRRVGGVWAGLMNDASLQNTEPKDWKTYLLPRLERHPLVMDPKKTETDEGVTWLGEDRVQLAADRAGHYHIPVLLNGMVSERMLVDTGATMCLIPFELSQTVGVRIVGDPYQAEVADGRKITILDGEVDTVEVFGREISNVKVGILPEGLKEGNSLLGMNLLSQFPMELTSEGMVLTISSVRP